MIKNNLIYLFIIIEFVFSSDYIKIINFNIHGFNTIGGKNEVLEIIKNVSSNDLIFFQENWSFENEIKNNLNQFNFIFSDRKFKIIQDSGLVIGVEKKNQIIDYEEVFFENCNGLLFNSNDCFASKGFIFSRIKIEDAYIDLYNTHLDAGQSIKDKEVREKQIDELTNYILKKSSKSNVIVAGDFNINYHGDASYLIDDFCLKTNLSFVIWDEKYFLENKIDYIFYSKGLAHLKYEVPDTLFYLSDHPPMGAQFKIIK